MSSEVAHRVLLSPPCLPGVDLVRITSNRRFPRHAHDHFGFGLMRSGGHVSWSASGRVEAGPGEVIAVSPNEIHDGAPIGDCRRWDMVYVHAQTVERYVGAQAASREAPFAVNGSPVLAARTHRVIEALRVPDIAGAEEALTDLLSTILEPGAPLGQSRISRDSRRVIERVNDRPEAPPSLDEVARLMGLGRTAALRRFRREVGATPHDYAMQLRLRLARAALASGAAPADVASELGFADQSHLTRAFSRQFGYPPGRFRSLVKGTTFPF